MRLWPKRVERHEPIPGTNISLWNQFSSIPSFWATEMGAANGTTPSWAGMPGNAYLADRVWVSNRCIQLNAQQVGAMPLRYEGTFEPAWVSAPDPNLFPNGIGDALHSMVAYIYGWGFCCLYVTDFYADGFPRTWTVLDSSQVNIKFVGGRREYKIGESVLDAGRVVQIDRNPSTAVHGTSALAAYAQQAWGLLAAGNQSTVVNTGGIPPAVIKLQKKADADQALALQEQWMAATARRNGAPPVLPPDVDFQVLSFDPKDMALIDTQEFNVRAIATAFGVPASLLNMSVVGGLTYQNPASLMEQWWRLELRPTAKRIADAFTAQLLPRGQWVWFDYTDMVLPLTDMSSEDDPQLSQVAKASPTQQQSPVLAAVGGGQA